MIMQTLLRAELTYRMYRLKEMPNLSKMKSPYEPKKGLNKKCYGTIDRTDRMRDQPTCVEIVFMVLSTKLSPHLRQVCIIRWICKVHAMMHELKDPYSRLMLWESKPHYASISIFMKIAYKNKYDRAIGEPYPWGVGLGGGIYGAYPLYCCEYPSVE